MKKYFKFGTAMTLFVLCVFGLIIYTATRSRFMMRQFIPADFRGAEFTPDGTPDIGALKSEEEWKRILTPAQYYILREAGTEIPFTGALDREKRKGTYYSVGCDKPVFRSEQKYDSGTGWPSFWAPIDENSLVLRKESSYWDTRIEVLDTCGGHLGHVFDDGPEPTGKRYCMNSGALYFKPD